MKIKNYKSVPNRTTIKSEKYKKGEFTIVPHHIMNNQNMSIYPKMLLIQLLSDSDNFSVSATLYAKRLKVAKSTIYKAIDELERLGYIKRRIIDKHVPVKNLKKKGSDKILYHYTISEFGNLNNVKATSTIDEIEQTNIKNQPTKKEMADLFEFLDSNVYARKAMESLNLDEVEDFSTNIDQYMLLLEHVNKSIPEIQKLYLAEVRNSLKDYNSNKYPESIKKKMDQRIKQVIFTENRLFRPSEFDGANNEAQSHWSTLTRKYNSNQYAKNTDYETLTRDKLEESYYDNQ